MVHKEIRGSIWRSAGSASSASSLSKSKASNGFLSGGAAQILIAEAQNEESQ